MTQLSALIASRLTGTEQFKTVAVLGSAPDAPKLPALLAEHTMVVAMNNAWRAVPRFDFHVYADDFPLKNRPNAALRATKGISSPQYMSAMQAAGGILCCGASMTFATGYWLLHALPCSQCSYYAADMTYEPGSTHFYGQGQPDPLRRDISLQDLRAKCLRLFYFALRSGCLFLNASGRASTRLAYPRVPSGASLRINIMAELLPQLHDHARELDVVASSALRLEQSAPFDIRAPEYWRFMNDDAAWQYVARIDSEWLELEPIVRSIERMIQSIYSARERAYGESRLPAGFDSAFYLLSHPDVAAAGLDAADHYLRFGRREGRIYAPTLKASPDQQHESEQHE